MFMKSAQCGSIKLHTIPVIAIGLLLGLMCLPAAMAKDLSMAKPEDLPDDRLCILLGMLGGPLPAFCLEEDEEPVPPIQAFPLSAERSIFTDDVSITIDLTVVEGGGDRDPVTLEIDDPSRVTVAEIVIQPGAAFPWHIHPGPVLAGVDAGEGGLVFVYADDCVHRHYETGNIFVDPGNSVHSAYNPSETEETIVVATFLDVPDADEDGNPVPLTIPIDDQEEAQRLDELCDIPR